MNITPPRYCKRCQFYHGANQVVCGLHPYGPDSKTCSDYVPKAKGLEQCQIIRDCSIRQFHDWKWQKIMILWLIMGILGFGYVMVRFVTQPHAPTTKTTTR